ncbi:hypothetical protein SAMN05443575_2783 [Jatrophihabitans endophyticus]|uniref:Uncharacterized protein n=1 Tax=Jatrophihabitans endophyticus TaxID=1206085 RepID=A0A1M5MP93_9ACTN|nr:hypothetical protein SAMN05443575_2783 [Jatrophihabitans endophyticus]
MEPREDHGPGSRVGERVVPATPAGAASATSAPVAEALRELDGLAEKPLAEHPDGYARVHAGLQRALAEIDDA